MEKQEKQIKKELTVNLEEVTIKVTKIAQDGSNEVIIIAINGKNYLDNLTFQLPRNAARELIPALNTVVF